MKEELIKRYLMNIDWDGNWSQNEIKEGLKELLGEKPALFIKYDKNVLINEETGAAVEFNELNYIEITYTDLDTSNGLKIKKYKQYIGI